MRKLLYITGFLLFALSIFGQQILVDDVPMCGHHNRMTYQALWDSLTSTGAEIDYTTFTGRYPALEDYQMVIIMHHFSDLGCTDVGFSYDQIGQLIEYVCHGGNLLVMPIGWDDVRPHNDLLNDPRWTTGLYYGGLGGEVMTTNIETFPPYTDGIFYLYFELTASMSAYPPAYAFAWTEDGTEAIAAISYPESEAYACSCETQGRILAIADNHTFEAPVVGYIEPSDHHFIMNAMLALSGLADTLPPCDPIPFLPSAEEIDTCLNPGDSYTIYGEFLYDPMQLYIGSYPVDVTFSPDSSSMTFIVPDIPQETYTVRINFESRSFDIGIIEIYCDWVEFSSVARGCYDIGDTIYFTGEGFATTGVILDIISSDFDDTVSVTDYEIITSSSGWLIVPDDVNIEDYTFHYLSLENIIPGNIDLFYIQIPCPCPGHAEMYSRSAGSPRPGDTRNPIVIASPPDTCLYITSSSITIPYSTSIDSFMSVPDYWPLQRPLYPINIYYSDDGVSYSPIAVRQPNTGSFLWAPPDTGTFYFILAATDSFGNNGADTFSICVIDFDEPPLTGVLREYECEPDSFVFTIRELPIVNMSSMIIHLDTLRFTFPDRMRWANDTTIIFYPPLPWADSTTHWLHLSEMVRTLSGVGITPDSSHALSTVFLTDLSAPEITIIHPAPDTALLSIPDTASYLIEDWLGVEDTSIWITINGHEFTTADSEYIHYEDSLLTVLMSEIPVDIESTYVTICLGAFDIDYPERCLQRTDTCYMYRLMLPPEIEYISPDDSIISSCARMEISYVVTDEIDVDWTTLLMTVGDETSISYGDPRIEIRGDTLIFAPDEDWPSCELVHTEITSILDSDGVPPIVLPVGGDFMLDLEPPVFWDNVPTDRVLSPSPIVSVFLDDTCTGVDPSSIWLTYNGEYYYLDSIGMSYSGLMLEFNTSMAGYVLDIFDTALICVGAEDLAAICGENEDSLCWSFWYYDLVCSLDIEISATDSICFGDSTIITSLITGGFGEIELTWEPSEYLDDPTSETPLAFPETSTEFIVFAEDDSGCTASDTLMIAVIPLPEINIDDTIVCLDSMVILHAGLGHETYEWNTGEDTEEIEVSASFDSMLFWVEVTDFGCLARDSFWVYTVDCTPPCTLEIEASADTLICEGDSALISVDPGSYEGSVLYSWSPVVSVSSPNQRETFVHPERTETYMIICTYSPECVDTDYVNVIVLPKPVIEIEDTVVCLDSTVIISVEDRYDTYLWSNGAISNEIDFTADTDSTLFWLEVSIDGCYSRDTFAVYGEFCGCPIELYTSNDTSVCKNESITMSASAAPYDSIVTFNWSPEELFSDPSLMEQSILPDSSLTVEIIATLNEECADTGYISVSVRELPVIDNPNILICRDSSTTVHAGSGFDTYLWNCDSMGIIRDNMDSLATSESISVNASFDSILYFVDVSLDGCYARDTIKIFTENCYVFSCSLSIDASIEEDSICNGDSIQIFTEIIGGMGNVSVNWTPSEYLHYPNMLNPWVIPEENMQYVITAVDDSGCVAVDTVSISIYDCDILDSCFIHPKPFTPNNDGINDFAKFEYPGMHRNAGKVFLYTLENEFVRDLVNGDVEWTDNGIILWDGLDEDGKLMKNGPYLYIVRVDGVTVCRGTVYIAR